MDNGKMTYINETVPAGDIGPLIKLKGGRINNSTCSEDKNHE